jgi:hypothetical protein
MLGWTILAILVVMAILAPRYGVDSRTNDSWTACREPPPKPAGGPTLARDIGRVVRAVDRQVRRPRIGR